LRSSRRGARPRRCATSGPGPRHLPDRWLPHARTLRQPGGLGFLQQPVKLNSAAGSQSLLPAAQCQGSAGPGAEGCGACWSSQRPRHQIAVACRLTPPVGRRVDASQTSHPRFHGAMAPLLGQLLILGPGHLDLAQQLIGGLPPGQVVAEQRPSGGLQLRPVGTRRRAGPRLVKRAAVPRIQPPELPDDSQHLSPRHVRVLAAEPPVQTSRLLLTGRKPGPRLGPDHPPCFHHHPGKRQPRKVPPPQPTHHAHATRLLERAHELVVAAQHNDVKRRQFLRRNAVVMHAIPRWWSHIWSNRQDEHGPLHHPGLPAGMLEKCGVTGSASSARSGQAADPPRRPA
jgi:hypothetical protein